jgi:hypothetical protein
MTTWRLPQESKDWVGPITVTDGAAPVTTFQVALRRLGSRINTVDWKTPDDLAGAKGLYVGPTSPVGQLGRGVYRLMVKYVASNESPVIDRAGVVYIV